MADDEVPVIRKDVFELAYMRSVRRVLDSFAQWPNKSFGDRSKRARMIETYHIILFSLIVVSETGIVLYYVKHWKTIQFIDIGQIYTNIILHGLFLQRISLPFQKKYCNCVRDFILDFHLLHHHNISEFAEKTARKTDKYCKLLCWIIYVQITFGAFLYNVVPFVKNCTSGMFTTGELPVNKTFQHSVDFLLPFDAYTSLRGYLIVFSWNLFVSYNIPAAMLFYDLLILLMVLHISGHLDILTNSLQSFPLLESDNPDEAAKREYNEAVKGRLKDVIRHYQIIKEFMTEMTEAFDLTLCIYLAFFQIMCCLMLLECSAMTLDALGKYGVLGAVIFQQLIQTSVVFETIHSKSEQLGDEVYKVPWEMMDNKNRKIVQLFLRNVQDPLLGLKACGMVPVGVLTMSTIIRTSFSYYLMLATLDG